MIFIGFEVLSSTQLGATVDYAILTLDCFKEERAKKERKRKAVKVISTGKIRI